MLTCGCSITSLPGDPAPQSPPIFSRHHLGDPTDGEDSSSLTAGDPTDPSGDGEDSRGDGEDISSTNRQHHPCVAGVVMGMILLQLTMMMQHTKCQIHL